MDFLELARPDRLYWLALLPLLYWLSRPPRPQTDHRTAHLALWLAARDRLRRRPIRFRWWRFLLLLMAFVMVVGAHTGLRVAEKPGPDNLVILVDTSASMAAGVAPGRTRLDEVGERVAAKLAGTPPHVEVRLGLCGAEVEVVRGTRPELLARLREARPAGSGGVDLAALAGRVQSEDTAVWTLTDGQGLTVWPDGPVDGIGRARPNVGIAACTVQDDWPLPEVRVELEIVNAGPATSVVLMLSGGIEAPVEQEIELPAMGQKTITVPVRRGPGGRLNVLLQAVGDGLPGDDRVAIDLPAPPDPVIAVRSAAESDGPLQFVAKAAATLAKEFGGTVADGAAMTAGFLLVDGGQLDAPPRGTRMLSFGTDIGGRGAWVTPVRLIDWDRRDPITAGLDLSELRIERALDWSSPGAAPPGRVLMTGDQGPLAVVAEGAVHLAFRVSESNFGKLAAFPQFVRRAFIRSYGAEAKPAFAGDPLFDAKESNLRDRPGVAAPSRGWPEFSVPAFRLAVPLLILALLCLAIRAYV